MSGGTLHPRTRRRGGGQYILGQNVRGTTFPRTKRPADKLHGGRVFLRHRTSRLSISLALSLCLRLLQCTLRSSAVSDFRLEMRLTQYSWLALYSANSSVIAMGATRHDGICRYGIRDVMLGLQYIHTVLNRRVLVAT